jgi:hypothetical protein
MVTWNSGMVIAAVLVFIGTLYIRLRWRRSPQAYRAMIGLTACYFIAGSIVGAWVLHFITLGPGAPTVETATPSAGVSSPAAVAVAPTLEPGSSLPSSAARVVPPLQYDPSHAVLPDPKLTPGDVFADATKEDVCTPGWATEHRHVTESDRDRAYAEYGRTEGPGCCEVDHLVPLELGGSNDIKNLWPQPDEPRPGAGEKDQLENTLHQQVCKGERSLADAQKCIESDWVKCWEKYVVPKYGPEWAVANRHGW